MRRVERGGALGFERGAAVFDVVVPFALALAMVLFEAASRSARARATASFAFMIFRLAAEPRAELFTLAASFLDASIFAVLDILK